jgi:hypothetical protein
MVGAHGFQVGDGARHRQRATGNVLPLQGRPGSGGAGEQSAIVEQRDLGVGAVIDSDRRLAAILYLASQYQRQGVRPHLVAHRGRNDDIAAAGQGEAGKLPGSTHRRRPILYRDTQRLQFARAGER